MFLVVQGVVKGFFHEFFLLSFNDHHLELIKQSQSVPVVCDSGLDVSKGLIGGLLLGQLKGVEDINHNDELDSFSHGLEGIPCFLLGKDV